MLDKKYNHLMAHNGKYEMWKNNGYFTSNDMSKVSIMRTINQLFMQRKEVYVEC